MKVNRKKARSRVNLLRRIRQLTDALPYSMKNFQKQGIATYAHQCFTNNACKNFENYFEVIESKINTRNNGTLIRLPKVKLELANRFYFKVDMNLILYLVKLDLKKAIKILKQKLGNFIISKISVLGYPLF